MKNSHRFLGTSGVAAAVLLYSLGAAVFAQDEPKRPINPGTGQISTRRASAEIDRGRQYPDAGRGFGCARPAHFPAAVGWVRRAGSDDAGPEANSRRGRAHGRTPRNEPPPSGPIGSFGQTIPAKFSKRNDILDHGRPWRLPLPLSEEQRSRSTMR